MPSFWHLARSAWKDKGNNAYPYPTFMSRPDDDTPPQGGSKVPSRPKTPNKPGGMSARSMQEAR